MRAVSRLAIGVVCAWAAHGLPMYVGAFDRGNETGALSFNLLAPRPPD